ncbi:Hypp8642 [Branchiostoma lanceolatum]|nr:Hypp8642 [Branchiostoma lanceolatum]
MMTWAELLDSIEQEVREVFPVKRFKLDVLKEHIHNGPSTLIDVKVTDKSSGKRLLIDCHQLKRKELRIQEVEFLANYALGEHCTHAAIIASPDANLTDQVQKHAVRVGVAVVRFQLSTFRRNIGQVFDNAAVLQKKKQHGDARKNHTSLNLNSTVRTHAQNEKYAAKSGLTTWVPRKISCRSLNGRYQVESEGVLASKVPPRDLVSSSWWLRKGTSTLWKTNTIHVQPSDVWQIHHVPNLQQLPPHLCKDLTQQSGLAFHSAPNVVQKQRYTGLWEIRQNSLWLFNTPQGANHVSDQVPIRTTQPSRVHTGGIVPTDTATTEKQTQEEHRTFHSQSWRSFTAATKTSQPKKEHSREVFKDPTTSDNCTAIPKTSAPPTMTETMRRPSTKLFAVTTGDETSQTPLSQAQETVKVTGIVQSKPQKNGTNGVSVVLRYPKVVKQQVLEPIVTVVGKVGEVALVKTMSVALLQLKTIVDTLFPLVGEFPTHLVKTLAYSVHLVRVSTTLIRRTPQRHAKKHRRAKHPARRDTAQCSHGGRLLVQGWRPIASLPNSQPMGRQRQQPIKIPGTANVCHVGRHHRDGSHIHEERNGPDTTQFGQRKDSMDDDGNVPSGPDDDALHPQSAISEVAPVKAAPSGDEQTCNPSTSHTDDVESLSPVKAEHLEQHDLETSVNVTSTESRNHDQGAEPTTATCELENEEDSMVNLKEETPEALRDDGRGGFSFIDDDSDDDITNDVMLKRALQGLFEPLKTDSNVKKEAAITEDSAPEHYVGINTKEEKHILSDESDNEDNDMLFMNEPLGGEGLFKAESLDSGCAEEEACLASSRKSSSSSFYSFLSFFSFSSSSSSSSNLSSDDSKIKKDGEKDVKEEAKIPRIESVDSEAVDSLCNVDGTGLGREEKDAPFDIGATRSSRKLSRDSSWSSSTSSSSDSFSFATPTRLSSGEINRVKYSNSPLNKYDGSPDMRIRVNRSSMLGSPDGSPRNANGAPDMRWTENRTSLCVKSPQGVPLNVNKSPDMRWKFNRAALLQTSPQGALLNVDGSPDRRFKVTRNLARRGRSDVSTRTLVFN